MTIELRPSYRPGGTEIEAYAVAMNGNILRNDMGRALIVKELNNGWQVTFYNPQDIWGGKRFMSKEAAVAYLEATYASVISQLSA